MNPQRVGEEPVYGLDKLARILRRSTRTLERQLDSYPDSQLPPIFQDDMGRYWAYPSKLEFWMSVSHMHAARARKLKRLERAGA